MNTLNEALRKAVADYMNVDNLPPRRAEALKEIHGKFVYNPERIQSMLDEILDGGEAPMEQEESQEEEEQDGD